MRSWKILNSYSSSPSKLQDFPGRSSQFLKKQHHHPLHPSRQKNTKTPQHPLLTHSALCTFVSPPCETKGPKSIQLTTTKTKKRETTRGVGNRDAEKAATGLGGSNWGGGWGVCFWIFRWIFGSYFFFGWKIEENWQLGGGFEYFLFSPLLGEMIQFH